VLPIYNALTRGAKDVIVLMAETAFSVSKCIKIISEFVPFDNTENIDFFN